MRSQKVEYYCKQREQNGTGRAHANTSARTHKRAALNTPPHFARRPRHAAKCFTLGEGSAFVSASATMSSVGQ
jgi:hypothetical protein